MTYYCYLFYVISFLPVQLSLVYLNSDIPEQSMIGRKILESQLQRIGVFGAGDTISKHPAFDTNYKICEYYVCHLINPGSWFYFSKPYKHVAVVK